MPGQNNLGILRLCGRWGIPLSDIRDLCFYEFQDLLKGAIEREQEQWRMAVQSGLLTANCFTKMQRKISDVVQFPGDTKPIASFAGPSAGKKGLEAALELLDGS